MNRREFIGSLAATGALATEARKPNIIYILADDLGFGELGCYGQEKIATPNIDRLAGEGVKFTQAYSGGAVCAPTRCCLMTGMHTGHARMRGNRRGFLREEDRTVAELLKSAGYRTGVFGKWGLGPAGTPGTPNRKGFDEWIGYLDQMHAHSYFPQHLWENEREMFISENLGHARRAFSHDILTRACLRFIENHQSRPFFLYAAFTIPHVNNELGRESGNGYEVPNDEPYTGRPWPQAEKNFASMIHRLDDSVGQIMTRLKQLGLDNDTVVMFSSDNGPDTIAGHSTAFFESKRNLRGEKGDFYEGGIRVPLIARWPGRIPSGATSRFVTASWDLMPTAAEIAGIRPPAGIDGVSILPALLGREQSPHEYMYWETAEGGATRAVRMENWKALRKANSKLELYNLAEDPSETRDVAARNPKVAARMIEIMESARTEDREKVYRNTLQV